MKKSHFKILKWAIERGYKWSPELYNYICSRFDRKKNLEALKWLKEIGR
jgi:hypothetical protein